MAATERARIIHRGVRVLRRGLRCAPFPALLVGAPIAAQSPRAWAFGGSVTAAIFIGEADLIAGGIGFDGTVWRKLGSHGSLRLDAMLMPLDGQTTSFESADNRMLVLSLGPELRDAGGPVLFYARALAGLAVNQQARSGSGLPERTTVALCYGGGAGMRLAVTPRVSLDVGGDILKIGEVELARTAAAAGGFVTDPVTLRLRAGLALDVS